MGRGERAKVCVLVVNVSEGPVFQTSSAKTSETGAHGFKVFRSLVVMPSVSDSQSVESPLAISLKSSQNTKHAGPFAGCVADHELLCT